MRKKASCQRINRIRTNNSNINLGSGKIMFDLFASHVSIALYIPILRSLFSPSSSFFSLSLSPWLDGGWRITVMVLVFNFSSVKMPCSRIATQCTRQPTSNCQWMHIFPSVRPCHTSCDRRAVTLHLPPTWWPMVSALLPQRAPCTACFYDECPYNHPQSALWMGR